MKKTFILLFTLFGLSASFAQDNNAIFYKKLEEQQLKNEQKFNSLQNKNAKSVIVDQSKGISNLAGFIEDSPFFYQTDDIRANTGAGITELQNEGINGFVLNGKDVSVLVMDGGAALGTHIEFRDLDYGNSSRLFDTENGATAISDHATSVSGFIAAEGRASFNGYPQYAAKGVLTKAKIKNSSFNTTTNGNNIQKLLNAKENLSNHSYGVNLGWDNYYSKTDKLGPGWYFNMTNYQDLVKDASATLSGSYYSSDADFDKTVYNNPNYIVVKSAGNYYGSGPDASDTNPKFQYKDGIWTPFTASEVIPSKNCINDAYCIGWGSLAKNIIVVGAVKLPNTTDYKFTTLTKDNRATFSSVGPRKDGAIKPDISTYGDSLIAPSYDSSNPTQNNVFIIGSGTSFSAPIVTGAMGMLTQLQRLVNNNSTFTFFGDEAKTLLLHTADEAGDNDGPDIYFGWGLLNTKKAAEVLLDDTKLFERKSKVSGTDIVYEITSDGTPLKASISWIDPEAAYFKNINDLFYNQSSRLINDFDLRVVESSTNVTYFPWKLDLNNVTGPAIKGDNTVDNYEQVLIKTPTKGAKYKVIVSNKGNLIDNAGVKKNQDVTVLITGRTTGALNTDELAVDKSISVYPTLAKDIVNVQTTEKITVVDIFDMTGKKVSSSDKKQINISNLPTGVYIINIKTDKQSVSKKIVKQ
ncbi:S8/S53 family peptidase [Empedobacter sp.]|nr:S8/S53 family peptidase [Empedobacter sp.]